MDLPEKWKLYFLLSLGKRDEALRILRETHRVQDEEASKLLAAIAHESPLAEVNSRKLWQWTFTGVFVVGLVFLGLGLIRYFAYTPNDDRQMMVVKCTVSEVVEVAEGLQVTFDYEFRGQRYTNVERSKIFRDLNLQKSMVLDLWVNADNPKDAVLMVLKPYVKQSGIWFGAAGMIMILLSYVGWRIVRSK